MSWLKKMSPERRRAMADRFKRDARDSMSRKRARASRMKTPGWKQRQGGASARRPGAGIRGRVGRKGAMGYSHGHVPREVQDKWARRKSRKGHRTRSARDIIDSGRARANPLWTDKAISDHRALNKKRRAAWKRGERYQATGNMRGRQANKDPRGRHLPNRVTSFTHLLDPKKMQSYRARRQRRWNKRAR